MSIHESTLSGSARTDSTRCVIDAIGGTTHNYSYCIKPPPLASEYMDAGGLSMRNVGRVFTELSRYVDYLIIRPDGATRRDCYQVPAAPFPHKPVIGNKYVLKTGLKCIPIDPNPGKKQTICNTVDNTPKEETLYKYINNVSDGSNFLTGGGSNPGGNGLLPAIAGNIGTLASNIVGVATSFAQESKPYCMEAQMSCHIISGEDSVYNYSGGSPTGLFFSLSDLREMKADAFHNQTKPYIPNDNEIRRTCISGSGFTNISENTESKDIINIINKNIINQNGDKLIYSSNIDEWLNINNSGIDFNDSTLVKAYYLGLMLLMLLIMFKILYGKQK
jgi:hypothetical protein